MYLVLIVFLFSVSTAMADSVAYTKFHFEYNWDLDEKDGKDNAGLYSRSSLIGVDGSKDRYFWRIEWQMDGNVDLGKDVFNVQIAKRDQYIGLKLSGWEVLAGRMLMPHSALTGKANIFENSFVDYRNVLSSAANQRQGNSLRVKKTVASNIQLDFGTTVGNVKNGVYDLGFKGSIVSASVRSSISAISAGLAVAKFSQLGDGLDDESSIQALISPDLGEGSLALSAVYERLNNAKIDAVFVSGRSLEINHFAFVSGFYGHKWQDGENFERQYGAGLELGMGKEAKLYAVFTNKAIYQAADEEWKGEDLLYIGLIKRY
ncbi:MAG: hypothetical protein OEZ43_20530 [Gammaproteobacteria bacterium]|nr:hypothetical protein [Gammaproteobacteria bacterium]